MSVGGAPLAILRGKIGVVALSRHNARGAP